MKIHFHLEELDSRLVVLGQPSTFLFEWSLYLEGREQLAKEPVSWMWRLLNGGLVDQLIYLW